LLVLIGHLFSILVHIVKKILTMTPSVPVWKNGTSYVFDRKFFDGMVLNEKLWPGEINCIMRLSDSSPPAFGAIEEKSSNLPFLLTPIEPREIIDNKRLNGSALVYGSGDDPDQLHLSRLCKQERTKCVYAIEYIIETRRQIMALETINPVVRYRRYFYLWNTERKRLAAFEKADGIQANGTAAFDEYKKFGNCLLYFDTRINEDLIIRSEELNQRLSLSKTTAPLRLGYSGRLISAKGVDHLLEVSRRLCEKNVAHELHVFGAGELEKSIQEAASRPTMGDCLFFHGAVDFYNELIPFIKDNIDVYVLLHRQSDPSCTYLETLSCGIPIIGYMNRAFSGILQQANVGWGVSMNNIEGVVATIERLTIDRESIIEKSRNSMQFALNHSFETTFKNRMDHLISVSE
jgi:colanic acid/amylovoran biosynthesis glycosyltransferase